MASEGEEKERIRRECQRRAVMEERKQLQPLFVHLLTDPNACEHDFQGWHEFSDGSGGEQVCTKCGMGAMAYSLRTGF